MNRKGVRAMKKTAFISLLCAVVMTISGCSGGGSSSTGSTPATQSGSEATTSSQEAQSEEKQSIRFMWWGGETRHKATVEAMDIFHRDNPNITVNAEYSGWDGYFDKLITQLAANTGPDVVQLSYTNASEYVARKQIVSLDSYVGSTIQTEKLSSDTLDMYRFDGSLYAVPTGVSTSLLFYNKDYFDKAGIDYPTDQWTWNDYISAAEKLTMDTDGDGKTDVWGTADLNAQMGSDLGFKKYLYERGGKLWSDDLKTTAFNTPEGLAAVEFIKKPLDSGIMPPLEITASNPQNVDDFQVGRVAMIVNTSPKTQTYMSSELNFGIERTPRGESKDAFWINPSMVYSITTSSQHPDSAAKLIDFMVNNLEAGAILKLERGAPANSEIRDAISDSLSEEEKLMFECINKSTSDDIQNEAFPAGYMELHALMQREFENMMFGKYTPEELLDLLETEGNKIFQKFIE